jgi:hypothetical protein
MLLGALGSVVVGGLAGFTGWTVAFGLLVAILAGEFLLAVGPTVRGRLALSV